MSRLLCACILSLALAINALGPDQVTYTYPDFSDVSDLQLNGDAASLNPNSHKYLLINPANSGQVGSFFLKESVPLVGEGGFQASFSTVFSFEMTDAGGIGDEDGAGADGIVFIINGITNVVGGAGGGIGYQGLGNSVGIEFDSYNNGYPTDINGNHVGIDVNGNLQSVASVAYSTRFNNNGLHYAWVDFNGATKTLEVRVSESSSRPATATLSKVIDLVGILGTSNVFVGFSAATGSGYENQIINSWAFTNDYAPIQSVPTAICGNGIVETGEQCDSTSCCTSTCTIAAAGTVCRASQGPCDPAESCDGSSNTCPADIDGAFETACPGNNIHFNGQSYSFENYDVISFGDFNSTSGDVEGRVAVRNNANVGTWSVGYKTHSLPTDETLPFAFVVGGNLFWQSGSVFPLPSSFYQAYGGPEEDVWVGGSFSTNGVFPNAIDQNECSTPGCYNSYFDAAQQCYAGYSAAWAAVADNVEHYVQWSGLYITCDDINANTYSMTLTPQENTEFSWVSISNCNNNARWVINIGGTGDVTFAGGSFPVNAAQVVYNIPGARNINMAAYQLNGNLIAPFATVHQPSGLIVGKLIAGNVASVNQVNKAQCFFPQGTVVPPPPVSHVCGNGIVEGPEDCDSTVCCTSTCTFIPASSDTVCRPSAGVCDIAEMCTGTSGTCPADSFEPYTYDCRPSIGPCDVAEYCTGSSALCPADVSGQFETSCSGLTFTLPNGQSTSWLNYDVIVFGDYNAGTGDIEARAAFKNNGNLGAGWSVGYQTHSSPSDETVDDALVVGRNLAFVSGQVYPNGLGLPFYGNEENIFVGGSFTGPSYLASNIDGTCTTPGCLDSQFNAVQQCYAGYSNTWAAQADNTHHTIQYDAMNLICNTASALTYYITLTPAELASFQSITIQGGCNINARWIINVVGTGDVTISNSFPVANLNSVIWNVVGSGRTINLQNSELDGSLVAPFNTMSQSTGVVKGKVIVADVASSNQINKYRCFTPSL